MTTYYERLSEAKEAAKLIKKDLAIKWPGLRFWVTTHAMDAGTFIRVKHDHYDEFTRDDINAVVKKYSREERPDDSIPQARLVLVDSAM